MNKQNLNNIPPRQFPKQQYSKLTHKIGLFFILPLLLILIGGGVGATIYHHDSQVHRTSKTAPKRHKTIKPKPVKHKSIHKPVKHQESYRPINVKQGEHLLGHWLRVLNYSDDKAQSDLSTYQKRNQNWESSISQQLNKLTHSSLSNQVKAQKIRHLINHNI